MGTTYSLPGEPSSYIQVNETGLKNCLAGKTGTNTINNCISENILGPTANGSQSGVNVWTGSSLPANPACPTKQSFQNVENVELTSQSKIVMLITIIITLLIVFLK
jgi:hypothetical protein